MTSTRPGAQGAVPSSESRGESVGRVAVIIPTLNGARLLSRALETLYVQTGVSFEVVVVDNGSTDDTTELLASSWPEVRYLRLPENRGFAAAVNEGIRATSSEFVVLMNNDVEPRAGWLQALVAALDRTPSAGACASRMLLHRDPAIIDSAGDSLGWFASSIGHGESDGPAFDRERFVLSACAGAAIYRRAALEQVGLFDERFFAYLEDVDLGVRLQLAGWKCLYVPDAVVLHHGSATAARMGELKLQLLITNSLFLFFQYMPLRALIMVGPAMLLWPFYRSMRELGTPRLGWRALRAAFSDARSVLERRAEVIGNRRVSMREFRSMLGAPRLMDGRT